MADFKQALKETMGNEGGYAFNPADIGRETYKGIARGFWPKWRGWSVIDNAKANMVNMPPYGTKEYNNWRRYLDRTLADIPVLQRYVEEFYKSNFWDVCRGDEIHDQGTAVWIFDHFVNAGAKGLKWAQEAAGATPDGAIGPKSVAAFNAVTHENFLQRARKIAGNYRLERVAQNPSQRQFLAGWLKRDGYSDAEIRDMVA